jgi:membrane protein
VVLGLVGTLVGTTFAFETLMRALNRCYEARETRSFPRRWGLAIAATILTGVTGIAAIVVTFAGPLIAAHVDGRYALWIRWARVPVAALLATTLWAFLYWALPNTRARFRLFTPGAVLGALLWVAASLALNTYVRWSRSYEVTYGALGGVVMILVWMWLSAAAILVGAEINKIVGDRPLAERRRAAATVNDDEAVTSS